MADDAIRRISVDTLREFGLELLRGHGLSREHATILAANLLEADMRGVRTHGHWLLPRYCQRLRDGLLNVRPNVRVVREHGVTIIVDGDAGPGQVAAHFTMQAVIGKAREHGVALGLTRNSNHFGAAANFAIQALEHDLIGYAATNAGASMFPIGGRTRVLGNNPIAYAIPAGTERPLVLDMAMSVSAHGRVAIAGRLDNSVPAGWFVDAQGRPSVDPADFQAGGAGVPIGGPKGIGLAQVVDALAGVLAGAAFGPDVGRDSAGESLGGTGHVLQAIDIEAFMPLAEFKQRMDEQIRALHQAERLDGVDRIYVAGEIEWERMDDACANGVPLLQAVIDDLNAAARTVGIPERL